VQVRHARVWYPAGTCKAVITEDDEEEAIANKLVLPVPWSEYAVPEVHVVRDVADLRVHVA
jgi:hypothetical protein